MPTHPHPVLLLPGWKNSGPGHWQTLWEAAHCYTRVEQHSWTRPLRGDWTARLEDVLLACDAPAIVVAHSLGCQLVAAWAAHSTNRHRIKAALLVAPPDVERDDVRHLLPSWAPVPLRQLPFDSVLLASSNDPYCSLARAAQFAAAWGSSWVNTGPRGHLNADSGLADWPEAHAQLLRLHNRAASASPTPPTSPTPPPKDSF